MILIGQDDFRFKTRDFSASGPNCFVYVIKAVQKLKISVFRKVPRICSKPRKERIGVAVLLFRSHGVCQLGTERIRTAGTLVAERRLGLGLRCFFSALTDCANLAQKGFGGRPKPRGSGRLNLSFGNSNPRCTPPIGCSNPLGARALL